LGIFLHLGQGEESSGGRIRPSNLARVLEAIIGAIFLDQGLDRARVFIRHALKNAMIPVITIIGMSVTLLVGGTVIMESIFSIPGMGRYLVAAISFRDYPVIQGVNLVICSTIIVLNLLVDLTYGYLDPRIRYQ